MNGNAHLPGQMFRQMSSQVPGPPQQIGSYMASQVQNLGPPPIDAELEAARNTIRQKIFNTLQRGNQTSDDERVRKLSEFVRRLEERILKDIGTREEYLNLALEPIDNRLLPMIKNILSHTRQSSHHVTSSSTVGTMIPTPGISNNGSTSVVTLIQPENPTMNANTIAIAPQTTANVVNLTAPDQNLAVNSVSVPSDVVTSSTGYQNQSANYDLGSGGRSRMSSMVSTNIPRQFGQMIPTPGFNNQQTISVSPECSNGVGFSRVETTVAQQPVQQEKYVVNQNSHVLHSFGAQIGAGVRSNVLQKGSYGFSNGLANGTIGLIRNNMQLNGLSASQSSLSSASYASSPKTLHNSFDQQHHQQRMPTSLSHQVSSMVDDDYKLKATDMPSSATFHGPELAGLTAMNSINPVSLHSKSRTNSGLLHQHSSLQSVRLPMNVRPHLLDHSEKLNYQSSQSTREYLLQTQQHAPQLLQQHAQQLPQQHLQKSSQQSNLTNGQNAQNQHHLLQRHQESIQNQQILPTTDSLNKPSVTSNFGEQIMPGNISTVNSESLMLSSAPQVQPLDLHTQYQHNASTEALARSNQFIGHLPIAQDFPVPASDGSQPLLHSHLQSDGFSDKLRYLSSGSQAEELLQFQWQSQTLQADMSDKLMCHQLPEEVGRTIGQDEAQQSQLATRAVDSGFEDSLKKQNYSRQVRWLLFLHHARRCPALKGLCKEANCIKAQELVMHMGICVSEQCNFPRCSQSKKLVKHICNCQATDCPVCIPVHNHIAANKARVNALSRTVLVAEIKVADKGKKREPMHSEHTTLLSYTDIFETALMTEMGTDSKGMKSDIVQIESSDDLQSLPKHMKVQQTTPMLSDADGLTEVKTVSKGTKTDITPAENSEDRQAAPKLTNVQHKTPIVSDISGVNEVKEVANGIKRYAMQSLPTENSEERLLATKRLKVQQTPFSPNNDFSVVCVPSGNHPSDFMEAQSLDFKQTNILISAKAENIVKMDEPCSSGREVPIFGSNSNRALSLTSREKDSVVSKSVETHVKQENMLVDNTGELSARDCKRDPDNPPTELVTGSKSGKPKIKGVSLTELFTPEQIKEHIIGLRKWVGQSKAKAEKNQAMERSMTENSCQLCAVERLTFEPPPMYCSPCGSRIKRNAYYYTIGAGETRHFFCTPCYNEARGDIIVAEGSTFMKAKLEKKKNDEETEEWWVQCDKCESWQHQICALFNGRRNDGEAEYTCPNCYMEEIERGERKPLPQSAVLGAKDLPRTILSDHIEQRLFRRLKQERQERAKHHGKHFDEVPGAEGLVVRVVSSVDKKLEVKQRFLEIFQEENFPKEFPYKSKAIVLFQKIEGVEVCLFGMYVQEFGSECPLPNQRRVYLSYLDSVKYFRPEVKTVRGEALRTFVYQEILIGYLEYCKKRGFTSCYIWACPPLKGEDYILYCHPEIQKTPRSDKLREWYLTMLRKASKENIVVELTNFYDHFFATAGECKAKITAARLPYFDGDYWPGAAEDMINLLRREEDGRKQLKKGKAKKTITKRSLKAAGQTDLSGNASKDALLMQKLGETIFPMKEDFIMVHLQHSCTHCCVLMVSGTRWVCNQCKNFQLCNKCHEAEQRTEERDRHPTNSREQHILYPVEINDVPQDTKDTDEILESEFFDTRQAFLSLCQGNHYQYDTLRRAKHSSMMILYHLHNPTAPAFVTTCSVCNHDIEAGLGWRCETCLDFEVCNSCYKKGGVDHPHRLTNHPSMVDRDAQNKEARAKRVLQLRKMLDLLVHAAQCRSSACQYPNCRQVKRLFYHGIQCKTRASGGCVLCKKMWYLLQIHSRACKESQCYVPRCRDLKEHSRRSQQQSDSRRRAAVMEMMRQRAAEVASGNG